MPNLQTPLTLGALELRNRIIMAPLTRCRASQGRVPNDLMAEYYAQRASAGLILSEATSISPRAVGYPDTPGLWTDEQTQGWKKITAAVHEKDGTIVAQLWHVGRISHPSYLDGQLPVAPSAIAADGHVSLVRPKAPFPKPHPLTIEEIQTTIQDYKTAAQNAKTAGFDGVEIHGANGYLPEQFLHSSTNLRTDQYGGSIENRARFMLAALDAALEIWSPDRVGLHLSPQGDSHDAGDETPEKTYTYIAQECKKRGIAFIFIRESPDAENRLTPIIKKHFGHGIIANQELTQEQAKNLVETNQADAASFGRLFIANPDLPTRLAKNAPLNEPNPETFYPSENTPPETGYTDYPPLSE